MANPDGYEYSRTEDRMWRKNMRVNSNPICPGVDLNRNWDFKYGVGASNKECSETYKGTSAFSEPETSALKNQMEKVSNMKMMLSIHSFGQIMLYPWGWTNKEAPDTKAMIKLASRFTKAASTNEIKYTKANAAMGFYFASGATDDWAKGVLNVKYSYTLELPNKSSFVIPAKNIKSISTKVNKGFKNMLKQLRKEK